MSRRLLLPALALLALLGAASAWWFTRQSGSVVARSDVVVLRWDGLYQGTVTLPATVNWCPGSRVAIVEGLSNDTGFVMVIHAADTLTGATHAVMPYEFIASSQQLPVATAALRWPADTGVLAGFRAQSGLLELVPAAGRLSGTFTVRMQPPMSTDTISVGGAFQNLVIESRAVGCP